MTSFWGHQDNPFPPYDDEPIGTDADGVPRTTTATRL